MSWVTYCIFLVQCSNTYFEIVPKYRNTYIKACSLDSMAVINNMVYPSLLHNVPEIFLAIIRPFLHVLTYV